MKNYLSLRIKIVLISILPGLVIAAGISAAYYSLTMKRIREDSRQRIEVAMAFLLDDFYALATTYTEKLDEFSQDTTSLGITADSYLSKPERIQSLPFMANYLMPLSDDLRTFGNTIRVDRLGIYAEDRRLLMFYQRGAEEDAIGAYVRTATGSDTYLSLVDTSQRMMMSVGKFQVKDAPLPSGIEPVYEGELPDNVSVGPYNRGQQFGIRMLLPIFLNGERKGVLVGELFYSQSLIERYASLSQAELNLFGPDYFSVGTLPAQRPFTGDDLQKMMDCQTFHQKETSIDVLPFFIENQAYYQGQCAFYADNKPVGALAVNSSQDVEQQAMHNMLATMGSIIGVVSLVSLGLAFFSSRKPVQALTAIMQGLNAVSEGNLEQTMQVRSRDEFGQVTLTLIRTIERLRGLVGQVQRSGIQVTSSATELAATAKEQEVTAAVQVDSTNKVREAVGEISRASSDLARTMQQVAAMSQDAANFANSGQSDLLHMEEAMRRMEDASSSIAGRLGAINDKAGKITDVVITITRVAEQTNLLSLNAAIEAEKAGEYGRGFTVVAREIRRLADQTAVATLDIEQMVKEMQAAVSAGVMEMDKFVNQVRQSANDVGKISMQLSLIIEQVQALSPNFDSVNTAMESQSENAQKINAAMFRLSSEMEQTKESIHETFSAIEHLHETTRALEKEVSRFKIS